MTYNDVIISCYVRQLFKAHSHGVILTDSSTPNTKGIEAFSLCMFSFRTFYQTLPSGSPFARYKRGTGSRLVTRPGVFEIPVAE